MTTFVFILFMLILSAGLAYGFYQIRKTDQSREAPGDDQKTLPHKLQREPATGEAERGIDRG